MLGPTLRLRHDRLGGLVSWVFPFTRSGAVLIPGSRPSGAERALIRLAA